MTRADIERAVADLFVMNLFTPGQRRLGEKAARIAPVFNDDMMFAASLPGWTESGFVDRLCRSLKIEE